MTILIVARHGNTFEPGETPRRIGLRTDLPLTRKGIEHGRNLGAYLKKINLVPDRIYTSQLQRTLQMAKHVNEGAGAFLPPQAMPMFNELDYGPDENQTEDKVIARIGEQALSDWEEKAIMPPGWTPEAQTLIKYWTAFGQHITTTQPDKTVMVITSNGIARFALTLGGDFEAACKQFGAKLATGAFGVLEHDGSGWAVQSWNVRP